MQKNLQYTLTVFFASLFLLLSSASFAGFREDVLAGNEAFKKQDWASAHKHYTAAYEIQPSPKLKQLLDTAKTNAFKSAVVKGNEFYRKGDAGLAFLWYSKAKSYIPDRRLDTLINRVKTQYPDAVMPAAKQGDNPLKWVLIGGDALLLIGAVAAGIAVSGGEKEYNVMYDSMNYSTEENFNLLKTKKTEVEEVQAVFGVLAVLAGGAIIYTIADAMHLHIVFPGNTAVAFEAGENSITLAINRGF